MKKTQVNSVAIVFLAMAILSSCVREVILDAGERSQVVVECVLTNDETQELRLNFTKGASKAEAEPLTEAVATLIDLTEGKTVGAFVRSTGDLWILDYFPVTGHRYRLEVSVPGYDPISGEDTMPEDCKVISYTYCGELWESRHPPVDNPFFRGTAHSIKSVPEITLVYGMNYNSQTGTHELADEIFTNLPCVDEFTITDKTYIPEIHSSAPSCCYPVESLYIDLKDRYKHNRYLRIEKDTMMDFLNAYQKETGEAEIDFIVFGNFTGDWYFCEGYGFREPSETEGFLVFESLSANYDSFVREAIHYMQIKESTDMSSIYLRDNIYSNIAGGLGIFAASSRQIQQCANHLYTGVAEDKFPQYGIGENGKFIPTE